MKRSVLGFFCILLTAAAASSAQVVPSAAGRQLSLTAGALGSAFQPDYAGGPVEQTSPNRLYGVGAYVDLRLTRWVQLEAEARWQRYNEYLGINEDNYLVGPRLPIHHFGRATPYAKALVGFGSGSFLTGHAGTFAFGGGVDYRLTKRISVRAIDFEYQRWNVTPTLYPYGVSAGIGYKIF
jgi:opacity protein-like surface antigen